MKIAQVVSLSQSVPPQSQNGLEFVVSWITEELVKRGHEVTLFAPANSKTNAKLESLAPDHIFPDKPWRASLESAWNTAFVASNAHEFDIIHAHTGTIAYSMPFIQIPVIQTLHEPFSDSQSKYTNHIPFICEQLNKITYVSVSKNQQQDFLSAQESFKKYTNIYNGIPVEKFEFNAIPKDYLFYIGYINSEKGTDTAVKVARALNMKLVLAGNNFGTEDFFKKEIEPYLGDKIQYIGPVDFVQKVELYKNAVATLAPIRWAEPFGLTLIESQACGTPVVAMNKGASAEIIKDGETGFVVEDEAEMIEAVKKISTIKREACRAHIEENFSVSKMVDEYEKLYMNLL